MTTEFNYQRGWTANRCRSRAWWANELILTLPLLLLAGRQPLNARDATAQITSKKNILIIQEVGLSHALTTSMTQQILSVSAEGKGQQIEFYSENLDLISIVNGPAEQEIRTWLARKYAGTRVDAIVAVGPEIIKFLANSPQTMFPAVPIIICGSSAGQAGYPKLDSRFTGTWVDLEPAKSLEVALRLFPETRHVVVVGGTTGFDRVVEALTKSDLRSYEAKLEFTYLTNIEMIALLDRLHDLPKQSIVFYTSFFRDAAGNQFINATRALPMIAEASNAPVFGMSDIYLGHGIVGRYVLKFQEQGKITAGIIWEILNGKKAQDIPIGLVSSANMFDWKELQRWHIEESNLPTGSSVLYRQPTIWQRTKWIWIATLLMILGLASLIGYLLYSRKQLELYKDERVKLSGLLISAQEKERSRLATELHDDFSQRLALLALGLENAAESISESPDQASGQLHELLNSAREIGADLHTLSHRLHSSTLQTLGLAPGVSALCKEFATQQGVELDYSSKNVPSSVPPDAALCLFRIVQEGLRNMKRHSGASKAYVILEGEGDKLHVRVRDEGKGFDVKEPNGTEGLGIRSMRERARLLGGRFAIHSELGKGTMIEAWVPLQPRVGLGND